MANLKHYDTVSIQFSRGCPFNCDFCNVTTLLGHRPRTKTAEQIIAELDSLYAVGWRKSIFFVDDNFIGNKKQIKSEVLPALIEWRKGKTGMPFNTEASINLADDPELMRLMTQAGFDTVFVGIETPNEDSLIECSKNQNKGRDLVESVKRLQRAGLQVQGGFIVGFDNDSPSIFQQQIDFIQKSGIVTAMVGLLQAPLGTRLYERMQKEGRLVNEFSGDNVDGSTNIIPIMGLEPLREGYRKILEQIYAPKFYYERVLTFLREYQPPKIRVQFELQYILAFGDLSTNWAYAASNVSNTGGSFSGPCSGVRVSSHWQSHSQSTAFISARLPLCMSTECEGPRLMGLKILKRINSSCQSLRLTEIGGTMKARKWYLFAGSFALILAILSCNISYNMGSPTNTPAAPETMVVETLTALANSGYHRNGYIDACFITDEYEHSWCDSDGEKSGYY